MKRPIAAFLLFLPIFSLCAKDRLFSAALGLSSGYPFYGTDGTEKTGRAVNDGGYRVIIGANALLRLNPTERLSFFADADVLCDFNWSKTAHANFADYAFSLGARFYPGLGGLAAGLGYSLGSRTDFLHTPDSDGVFPQAWGNGFKLLLEYDLAHGKQGSHLPVIGAYWRRMPRGNNSHDTIVAAYLLINL